MKRVFQTIILLLTFQHAIGQEAKTFDLIHHSFTDHDLGKVNFYITDSLHNQTKPLLLFLDGSGSKALFSYKKGQGQRFNLHSSIPFSYKRLAADYHIVFISKPNVALLDTVMNDTIETVNKIYDKYASAYWRTHSASKVINYIIKNYAVDTNKVVVFGYSEGGQVAPRVAVENDRVTHCISFVSGGLNQLFDPIIAYRLAAAKGEIT